MEIFKSFGIQPIFLLAQIVNFLIILYLLKRFFYKPIIKILEDRKKKIEESLKNADLIEERLQKTDEKNAQILSEAQNSARILIADAKREAENINQQAHLEARKTIGAALVEAKVQIEAQKVSMKKQLEHETLNLVEAVVKRVLGRSLKINERRQLTDKALSDIGRKIE